MKSISFYLSLIVSGLIAAGCSPSSNNINGNVDTTIPLDCTTGEVDSFGIISGKTVKENSLISKSVFLIRSSIPGHGEAFCTATLIQYNLLLTAAHCVSSKGSVAENGKVYFSTNPACAKQDNQLQSASFANVIVSDEYLKGQEKTENDMAIIRFEGRAPQGSIPLALGNPKLKKVAKDKLFAVGYGNQKGYSKFDKNPVRLRVTSFEAKQLSDASNFAEMKNVITVEQKNSGVCSGDSGGPLIYIDETEQTPYIMGIASTVSNQDGGEACAGYSNYNNALKLHDWLTTAKNALSNR